MGNPKRERKLSPEKVRRDMDNLDENSPEGSWYIGIPRALFYSRAYLELTKTKHGPSLLLAIFDELDYEKSEVKDRKGVKKGKSEKRQLKNGGVFSLPNDKLHALGIGSDSTIAKLRRLAWELGFFDNIKPGSYLGTGTFKYSERWKHFPNGPYWPVEQEPPGKWLGYGFEKRKSETGPSTASVVSHTTPTEVTTSTSVAEDLTDQNPASSNIGEWPTSPLPHLPKSFIKFGGDAREPSGTGDSRRGEERTSTPPHDSSRGAAIPREVDRAVLEMGIPAKIVDAARSIGHECVGTRFNAIDNEAYLQFSHGHGVKVTPRHFEHTDADGKITRVKELSHIIALVRGMDPKFILFPEHKQSAERPPTKEPTRAIPLPRHVEDTTDIERIMEEHGYGLCTDRVRERGELHLVFGDDVHLWIMPGSIKVLRTGLKTFKVKGAQGLDGRLGKEKVEVIAPQDARVT